MTTTSAANRNKPNLAVQRLSLEAEKAIARADAAKERVRGAKSELKKVRKLAKTEKKAAKHVLKKLEAAQSVARQAETAKAAGLPSKTKTAVSAKARGGKSPLPGVRRDAVAARSAVKRRQSPAAVAKSVIRRLAAAKPVESDPAAAGEPVGGELVSAANAQA